MATMELYLLMARREQAKPTQWKEVPGSTVNVDSHPGKCIVRDAGQFRSGQSV